MSNKTSNNIIILCENKNKISYIVDWFKVFDYELDQRFLQLNSLSILRKIISANQNTVILRTELFRFIKENGYPFAIIMDATIDSGLDSTKDADGLRIFRTLLISYIILRNGKGFENISANILLICNDEEYEWFDQYRSYMHRLLYDIKTNDTVMNNFITYLIENPTVFNSFFYITAIKVGKKDEIELGLENFVHNIKERSNQQQKKEAATSLDNTNHEPAEVVFKNNDIKLVENDTVIHPLSEQLITNGQFIVNGYWTNKTQFEVVNRLIAVRNLFLLHNVQLKKNFPITILIDDTCSVDGSTAISLSGLIHKDFSDYAVTIKVSNKNGVILKKSKGFIMIKNNIKWL